MRCLARCFRTFLIECPAKQLLQVSHNATKTYQYRLIHFPIRSICLLIQFHIGEPCLPTSNLDLANVAHKLSCLRKFQANLPWKSLVGFTSWLGWVNRIMIFTKTMSYMIHINDQSSKIINPSKGLPQGDRVSPYLFIICWERLDIRYTFWWLIT